MKSLKNLKHIKLRGSYAVLKLNPTLSIHNYQKTINVFTSTSVISIKFNIAKLSKNTQTGTRDCHAIIISTKTIQESFKRTWSNYECNEIFPKYQQ